MENSYYKKALKSEHRKIRLLSKDLPLTLQLLTHTINALGQQSDERMSSEQSLKGQPEYSGQTSTDEEGPVLMEFMPIKKRASSSVSVEEEDDEEDNNNEQHSHQKVKISQQEDHTDKHILDWLISSSQSRNTQPPLIKKDNNPRKSRSLEVRNRGGGVFWPFHIEATSVQKSPLTPNKVSSSSVAGRSKKEEKKGCNYNNRRKERRCWTQELHQLFVKALHQLGGSDLATPRQIRELMNVNGLTNDEVKSHLQKFRLHENRSVTPVISPPFLVVRNSKVTRAAERGTTSLQIPGVPREGGEWRQLDLEGSKSEDSEVVYH